MSTRCKFEMNLILEDGDTGATLWKYRHSNCLLSAASYMSGSWRMERSNRATSYPRTRNLCHAVGRSGSAVLYRAPPRDCL